MTHILIMGNSASGKSTLARHLAATQNMVHLDLDPLAWQPTDPPQRRSVAQSLVPISAFTQAQPQWVIEGCYADLLEMLLPNTSQLLFLDLPVSRCIENARARPWEPHKYASKKEQDANLAMLIDWIAAYDTRTDCCSKAAHEALFNQFGGEKLRYTTQASLPV